MVKYEAAEPKISELVAPSMDLINFIPPFCLQTSKLTAPLNPAISLEPTIDTDNVLLKTKEKRKKEKSK